MTRTAPRITRTTRPYRPSGPLRRPPRRFTRPTPKHLRRFRLPQNAVTWTTLGTNATGPTLSANTIVATVGSNQVAGTITVAAAQGNSTTLTCTFSDSRGNTWQTDGTGPAVARRIFAGSSKPATLLVSTNTVTATFSALVTDRSIAIYAVAGLDQTTWFTAGKAASASGTNTAPDSTTVAATGANNYAALGICGFNNAGVSFTAGTDGNGNSYTKRDEATSTTAFHLAVESTLSITGFTTYKATGTITSAAWAMMVVLYNVAAGGSVVQMQVAITGLGTVAPNLKVTKALRVAVVGTSALTPPLKITESLKVAVAGSSAVSPTPKVSESLKVNVAGTSAVSPTVSFDTTKRLAVAIAGTAVLLVALTAGNKLWQRRRRYLRHEGRINV